MEKFKQIQNRLNNISVQDQNQGPNKIKIRQLQSMISRLTSNLQEDDITRQYKLNQMMDKLRKIQTSIKDSTQQTSIKQSGFESTLNRVQKGLKKKLQKLGKLKKQADKEFQSSLSSYLIELGGFKAKMNHSCLSSINLLKQKQSEIQQLQKNHSQQACITKQILKKIYQQYTTQLEQLNSLIIEQQHQRRQEQQLLLGRIQKVYQKLKSQVKNIKADREKSEAQMISLLEKVVDKVRNEVVKF